MTLSRASTRTASTPRLCGGLLVVVLAIFAVCVPAASAQLGAAPGGTGAPDIAAPPPPAVESQSSAPGPWLGLGVGVLLVGTAVFLAWMPSRRTHQD